MAIPCLVLEAAPRYFHLSPGLEVPLEIVEAYAAKGDEVGDPLRLQAADWQEVSGGVSTARNSPGFNWLRFRMSVASDVGVRRVQSPASMMKSQGMVEAELYSGPNQSHQLREIIVDQRSDRFCSEPIEAS